MVQIIHILVATEESNSMSKVVIKFVSSLTKYPIFLYENQVSYKIKFQFEQLVCCATHLKSYTLIHTRFISISP